MSRASLWRFLAIALPVLGALIAPLPSVDLTYQLRAGAEILDSGAIPSVDSWTFTAAGTPWLDQQWASQVLLTLAYRLGGWTGLVLLRAALVGLAFGLLLVVVRRRAPRLGAIASALLVIAAFLVSMTTLALRPQLFAIDLFVATLLVLAIRDTRPRLVWLIPVLALAWANLHGTFLLAAALCGLAWFADLAELPPSRGVARHRMLLVGLVAAAVTVVTPFGPAVWGYVANLTSNPTIAGRVSEWQPPWQPPLTVPGALVLLSLAVVAVLVIARLRARIRDAGRRAGAIPWPGVLTLLVFGGFAFVSGRGTAWWPFVAAFVVAPWLGEWLGRSTAALVSGSGRSTPRRLRLLNGAVAALLVVVAVAVLPLWRPVGPAGVPAGVLSYAPQSLAAQLNDLPLGSDAATRVRVWNPQVWGSWLEFASPGRFSFALDSRIELFGTQVWDEADLIDDGNLGALTRQLPVVVITNHATDGALEAALWQQAFWQPVFEGCAGTIWLLRSSNLTPAPVVETCPGS